jgi:excisionase family DNA binding protein
VIEITLSIGGQPLVAQFDDVALATIAAALPSTVEPSSPYMTIPEAAEYLCTSRQRIDDLLSSGRLHRVKEGRRTLVERAELEGYLCR